MALSFFSIVKRKKDKKNEARIKPLSLSLIRKAKKQNGVYTYTKFSHVGIVRNNNVYHLS